MSYLAIRTERQLQSPWQFLCEVDIVVVRPSEGTIAKIGILIVLIACRIVEDEGRGLEGSPLHILLEGGTSVTLDIVVGQVAYITICCLDRGDATITELTAWSQLKG